MRKKNQTYMSQSILIFCLYFLLLFGCSFF